MNKSPEGIGATKRYRPGYAQATSAGGQNPSMFCVPNTGALMTSLGKMDFVALDVETANADMASICQIGIARFRDGTLADEWQTYIDPQDHFDEINVSIHGIDASIVEGAPRFGALASTIEQAIHNAVVVTHTAFDRLALHQARTKCNVPPFACTWLDSACVARRTWREFSRSGYGLSNVCEMIGYNFRHHDALEDAKASGQIMLAAMAKSGLDLNGWLDRVRQPIELSIERRIVRNGNPEGELYGEVLVFTGALTILRREAADYAAQMGCEVADNVTKRTTILVVGDQDLGQLAGHQKSSKHRRAEELIRKGQSIRILQETDFRELVNLST
jgi:DNA polymerase III subunit epsilon